VRCICLVDIMHYFLALVSMVASSFMMPFKYLTVCIGCSEAFVRSQLDLSMWSFTALLHGICQGLEFALGILVSPSHVRHVIPIPNHVHALGT